MDRSFISLMATLWDERACLPGRPKSMMFGCHLSPQIAHGEYRWLLNVRAEPSLADSRSPVRAVLASGILPCRSIARASLSESGHLARVDKIYPWATVSMSRRTSVASDLLGSGRWPAKLLSAMGLRHDRAAQRHV